MAQSFQKLLKEILGKDSNFFKQNKTFLPVNDFKFFWSQLQPENTTQYVQELIKLIIEMEQSNTKNTLSIKVLFQGNKEYTIENLLATLLVISTYKTTFSDNKKKQNKDYEQIQKKWQEHQTGSKKVNPCPYSSQIITNFLCLQRWEIDEQVFISNLIGQICFLPDLTKNKLNELSQEDKMNEHFKIYYSNLDSYTKSLKSENQPYYSVLQEDEMILGESGELCYAYEYLIHYIDTKTNKQKKEKRYIEKNIYEAIKTYFKHIPYIARDYPEQAEKSCLALLHLTKQLFTFYSSTDHESIRSVLTQVQIFRRWSYPIGPMASELVNILFSECKSHGTAFRQKVREEMPKVDFLEVDNNQQDNQDVKNNYQNQQNNQKEERKQDDDDDDEIQGKKMKKQAQNRYGDQQPLQTTYFVADTESLESQYLIRQAQFNYENKNDIKNAHILRASLIANMLAMLQEKQEFDFWSDISIVPYKNMFLLYCRLLEVLEQCEELDSLIDFQLIQDNAFQELKKQFIAKKGDKDECDDSQTILNVINQNTSTFIPQFPLSYFKPMHSFTNQKEPKPSVKGQIQTTNKTVQQIIKELEQILEHIKQENLPLHQEPVRIVVMGGDLELYNFMQAIGEIFQREDQKMEKIYQAKVQANKDQQKMKKPNIEDKNIGNIFLTLDMKIFLVPSKKNTLATFIASKDPWYQRYLYIPFKEEIIIPRLQEDQKEKMERDEKDKEGNLFTDQSQNQQILFPYELKLNALNTYIREAEKTYNVRTYKIKPSYLNQAQGKSMIQSEKLDTIFFCQYLEIGASVAAEIQKNNKKNEKKEKEKDNLYTLYEMKEKNQLKNVEKELKISLQTIDFVGNIGEVETTQQQIHNLRLNNVYRDYFEGNIPYPNVNWLELTYITQENSKIFDTHFKEKNIFKKYDKEQLQIAFKSLHVSLPVHKIKIQSENKQCFDILVDGKIIKDIVELEVEPLETQYIYEKKVPLTLPIATFLPLKL